MFSQMVKMIVKLDPIMKEHIRHAEALEIQYIYLSNASHEEQMSLIIRCVDDSTNLRVVEEY